MTPTPPVPSAREHELKCWPHEYDETKAGRKPFEWRRDDRGFAVGDVLILRRWDPHMNYYTGPDYPRQRVVVTYILRGEFGVPPEFVVMGIRPEALATPAPTELGGGPDDEHRWLSTTKDEGGRP